MSEINRSLLILKPKQPFLDWASSLDEEGKRFTREEMVQDSIAYLIPELWEDADQKEFLKSGYDILFDEQLSGWWTDEAAWPKERSLKMFQEWFELEFSQSSV